MTLAGFLSLFRSAPPPSGNVDVDLTRSPDFPDGLVVLRDGRIRQHNPAFARLVSDACSGSLFKRPLTACFPDTAFHRVAEILSRHDQSGWQLLWFQDSTNNARLFQLQPLRGPAGEKDHTWLVRDRTEFLALEAALTRARDDEKAKLARDLHDSLGQKITGLGFQLYALQVSLAGERHPAASTAANLVELANDVGTHARDLAHSLAPVDIDPEGLYTALEHLANTTAKLFGITCTFEPSGPRDHKLSSEAANALYRICQEALTNAHNHGRAKAVRISLTTTPRSTCLAIHDNGSGFTGTSESGGMGLKIMRHRARSVGGTLNISSAGAGLGTEVTVLLEQAQSAPKPETADSTPSPETQDSQAPAKARLLIVDDHPVVRAGLRQLIDQTADLTVCGEAPDGSQAIELCETLRPSLLVTDMLLGDNSALEYVREVRQRFPNLPIAVLSMYPPERYEKPSLEAGANRYLSKQTAPAELLEAFRELASKN